MASTTTKISTKKFHFPTELRRGGRGGGPAPFVVKDYKKGIFFFDAFPYLFAMYALQRMSTLVL